jgi:hypothetical protein
MKAILAALVVLALAAPADARPPRVNGTNTAPLRASGFYDESRYGEFLPYSHPGSAFSTYGVPYARPAYRTAPPARGPEFQFNRSNGAYLGTFNGGFRGSLLQRP